MPHELGHACEGCDSEDLIVKCPECGGEMEYDYGSEGHLCKMVRFQSDGDSDHPKTGGYDGYK